MILISELGNFNYNLVISISFIDDNFINFSQDI
jgi:hypothetical protein